MLFVVENILKVCNNFLCNVYWILSNIIIFLYDSSDSIFISPYLGVVMKNICVLVPFSQSHFPIFFIPIYLFLGQDVFILLKKYIFFHINLLIHSFLNHLYSFSSSISCFKLSFNSNISPKCSLIHWMSFLFIDLSFSIKTNSLDPSKCSSFHHCSIIVIMFSSLNHFFSNLKEHLLG